MIEAVPYNATHYCELCGPVEKYLFYRDGVVYYWVGCMDFGSVIVSEPNDLDLLPTRLLTSYFEYGRWVECVRRGLNGV